MDSLDDLDLGPLLEEDVAAEPLDQFRRWYREAEGAVLQADAMVLATSDPRGRPSARAVILRGVDHGLVFYTNYRSPKALDLAANKLASACLLWPPLRRQVRLDGAVEKVSAAESDHYFSSRPRGAQISAAVSPQSEIVKSRAELEAAWVDFDKAHPGVVDRPEHWGGYRLVPDVVEFWQGRPDRLHDRLRYRRVGESWLLERLAP